MVDLKELNELLLDAIDQYVDSKDEREMSLLEVLTDACMEVEEFLCYEKSTTH